VDDARKFGRWMLLTAAVLQMAYDVGEPIYELAREKMVGAVSVMAVCASVPGQRSPSAARTAAKTRLMLPSVVAAVLGLVAHAVMAAPMFAFVMAVSACAQGRMRCATNAAATE
jgi:hypothetical protein